MSNQIIYDAALLGIASANLTANIENVEATERHSDLIDARLERIDENLSELLEVFRDRERRF